MIVKPPENKFELDLYTYINSKKFNGITNEGEKGILYDLCIMVQKQINKEIINVPKYIEQIRKGYTKNRNVSVTRVIFNCINMLDMNIKADIKTDIFGTDEQLVINKK